MSTREWKTVYQSLDKQVEDDFLTDKTQSYDCEGGAIQADETPTYTLCKLFRVKKLHDDEGTSRTELYSITYGKHTFIVPLLLIGCTIGLQFAY